MKSELKHINGFVFILILPIGEWDKTAKFAEDLMTAIARPRWRMMSRSKINSSNCKRGDKTY